ncbi:response regulator [candidate division WOR-3 bacterium]|nr:response regulator [candidate division WOR-3 bacterium]
MRDDRLGRPARVLLVEDDPGDIELTRETLREGKVRVDLKEVRDGERALQYLRKQGEYRHALQPDLVILDLNLPRKDGRTVLSEMKADEELRKIPVVVLTTSSAEEDVVRSYGLGANCYVTKPLGLEEFSKIVKAIESFWLSVVRLPPNHD